MSAERLFEHFAPNGEVGKTAPYFPRSRVDFLSDRKNARSSLRLLVHQKQMQTEPLGSDAQTRALSRSIRWIATRIRFCRLQ